MRASRMLVLLLAAVLAAPVPAAAQDLELRVKSAFLYNFARFITWPAEKFTAADSALQICVLEPDPFGAVLDDTVRGKSANGHPLVVWRTTRIEDAKGCHILYLGGREAEKAESQLARLAGSGVLTVHESDRALRSGGARFLLDDRKVRFEINAAATEREKLQLNPTLERLALVVRQ